MKLLLAGLMMMSGLAWSDEVMLFGAANAGPDVWSWEGAKLKAAEGGLVLTPDKGDLCSVVLQDRFAWMPQGEVVVDVRQAVAGTFTLQALAFKGVSYLGSQDVIRDSDQKGVFRVPFSKLAFPKDTETVTFKLWVSRSVGTAITFGDIQYVVPVHPEQMVYDKKIDISTEVMADQAVWTPSDAGGKIQLAENMSFGSVVFPDQIVRPEGGHLVLQVKEVKNGTLTAQVCAFNAEGNYLDSRDVIKKGTASLSGALDNINWPEGTATFQVKVWLGGTANASATIQRIMVLR